MMFSTCEIIKSLAGKRIVKAESGQQCGGALNDLVESIWLTDELGNEYYISIGVFGWDGAGIDVTVFEAKGDEDGQNAKRV